MFRTCGGGGVSGVMLASRLSPSTSRRPPLRPSSSISSRNTKIIELQSLPSDCVEPIQIRRRLSCSKACDMQIKYEDGNTRPPPSSLSSIVSTCHLNSLIPSSLNSSPSVLTVCQGNHNGQSSDTQDNEEAFSNTHLMTATNDKSKSRKRLRIVHSTTR